MHSFPRRPDAAGSGRVEVVPPPKVRADLTVTAAVVARYG
jgi:hypothetical protein